jgi:hypothetical protein
MGLAQLTQRAQRTDAQSVCLWGDAAHLPDTRPAIPFFKAGQIVFKRPRLIPLLAKCWT